MIVGFEFYGCVAHSEANTHAPIVVINTASAFHTNGAKALLLGLGDRKKETGKEVFYIHVRSSPLNY